MKGESKRVHQQYSNYVLMLRIHPLRELIGVRQHYSFHLHETDINKLLYQESLFVSYESTNNPHQ